MHWPLFAVYCWHLDTTSTVWHHMACALRVLCTLRAEKGLRPGLSDKGSMLKHRDNRSKLLEQWSGPFSALWNNWTNSPLSGNSHHFRREGNIRPVACPAGWGWRMVASPCRFLNGRSIWLLPWPPYITAGLWIANPGSQVLCHSLGQSSIIQTGRTMATQQPLCPNSLIIRSTR